VAGVFVRERVRARLSHLGPDVLLLAKVEADIAEPRHQRELLCKMRTWYLGPVFAVAMVVSFMLTIQSQPWSAAPGSS
jgi:hypothetical protein